MYSGLFPKDPRFIRWTVWTLFTLDTVHIACSWHMVYHYLVNNFNNDAALDEAVWSFSATIVVTLVLSLLRLVFGLLAAAQIIRFKTFRAIQHRTIGTVLIGLGSGTVADCIITASLVYLLRVHKSQMSPSLNTILARITYWTVNNGLLTCVVEVAFLVTQFSPMRPNMIFIALHFLLSKLYANSLLATLNSREAHRSGHGVDTAEQHSAMAMANVVATVLHIESTGGLGVLTTSVA
ncbi:hypothetical protein BC628DRAFT_846455 [Trametes gibbosa]|nr:hypothetical protein BC628DRAFT_846455 [Trametes gibbosa]